MPNVMDFTKDEPHGIYFVIDMKSFYASVEACQRQFNPLKIPLVVVSHASNTGGGLVLATSPMAKKLFGLKANVSRQRDIPQDPRLVVVPPRMNLYIQKNLQINNILARYIEDDYLVPYSIDESIARCDLTYRLYARTPREFARLIQKAIRKETGIYATVGIGENPLQAKLALDNYAKHNPELMGQISYNTVPEKIWSLTNLTDIWSIGDRTAKRLNRMQIFNMRDLSHCSPYRLVQEFGPARAGDLYSLSWGIDRTDLARKIKPRSQSIGNSQVLPKDYRRRDEIETVIKEIGEQVASRLRAQHVSHGSLYGKKCSRLDLSVGFSYDQAEVSAKHGFHVGITISPTNDDREITGQLIYIFRQKWQGEVIRNIAISASRLSVDSGQQLNLFDAPQRQIKNAKVDQVVDTIRKRFGVTKLVYANSLKSGGTLRERAGLVGGHNGGNAFD